MNPMFSIKTDKEIQSMREGGRMLAAILDTLVAAVKPGMMTREISALAAQGIKDHGVKPSFLDYNGYPDVICLSVNAQAVHTPGSEYVLKEGDLLKLDFGVVHDGLHTDMARTILVTNLDKDAAKEKPEYKERRRLIAVTRECLEKAISQCEADKTLGDIGFVIQQHAQDAGFSVAKELGGHGVGYKLHEEPWIANFGKPHSGARLPVGAVIAIEPIITMGKGNIRDGADGHTYETVDGSLSAHFEHTIAITEKGPEVLTA